jgi:hypothetical protein
MTWSIGTPKIGSTAPTRTMRHKRPERFDLTTSPTFTTWPPVVHPFGSYTTHENRKRDTRRKPQTAPRNTDEPRS